jgi:hypothetical protein
VRRELLSWALMLGGDDHDDCADQQRATA